MPSAIRKSTPMVRGTADPALSAAIRQARDDAGLTQMELAVRAGLALGTLTRLEAGTTDPSWSSVRSLARALGISLTALGRLVEGDQKS